MLVRALVVMAILAGGLSSALPLEAEGRNVRVQRDIKECPAGQYLDGGKCSVCGHGSYTKQVNSEHSCHPCFKNCMPELNMEVVKECSTTSDVVCRCKEGFSCSESDTITGQCSICVQVQTEATTSQLTTLLKPTFKPRSQLLADKEVWILIAVPFGVLLIIIIIIQHLCRQRRKECFKKLVKQCSFGNQKGDIATTTSQINEPIKNVHAEEVHPDIPTSSCSTPHCPTPQPASTEPPLAAGNLGPLHIYGAGTVFVSLLNQFGQNRGEKDDEDLHQPSLNKSELCCPTSPLPLSTEERNRDSGYISFPSQEQGKECHMSKEEGL